MKVTLYDERVKFDEPSYITDLGETTHMSLLANGSLCITTDLAYRLIIELTKADMDKLRNRLIEIDTTKRLAAERREAKRAKTEMTAVHPEEER